MQNSGILRLEWKIANQPNTEWAKKSKLLFCGLYTSSIMHQFKEIPLLESLLNFQKDDCMILVYY